MRKRLLYITTDFPYPDHSGGRIKTLNSIKTLAQAFNVYLISLSPNRTTTAQQKYLEKFVVKMKNFHLPQIDKPIKNHKFSVLINYLICNSYFVTQYHDETVKKHISKIITEYDPDVIHIDHLNIAQYLPQKKTAYWILEHHNIEYCIPLGIASWEKNIIKKIQLFVEAGLIFLFEKKHLPLFDWVYCISHSDLEYLQQTFLIPRSSAQRLVYPPTKKLSSKKSTHDLLFLGGLNWPPNLLAVEWFIASVWPHLKTIYPCMNLYVVGKMNSQAEILKSKLNNETNIHFVGYQKRIDSFLNKAGIFIIPVFTGSGVRIKALTAMAHGLPIISSELGVKGLDVNHLKEVFLAETALEFVAGIKKIISNPTLKSTLIRNASRYVSKQHGYSYNASFLKHYLKITSAAQ